MNSQCNDVQIVLDERVRNAFVVVVKRVCQGAKNEVMDDRDNKEKGRSKKQSG